jgi:hypothetical protein
VDDRVRELEVRLATIEATVEQRLTAGAAAFESQRAAIASLAESVAQMGPKPMTMGKLAGIIFGVAGILVTAAGALWALGNRLDAAQTSDQVQQVVDRHSHPDIMNEVRAVQATQTEQRVELREFRRNTERDLTEIKAAVRKPR